MARMLVFVSLALLVAVQANPARLPNIRALKEQDPVVYAVDINKMKFMLYTKGNKDTPQQIKVGNAGTLGNFNKNLPTKILIHGWQNTYEMEAVQSLKDAYLSAAPDVNVVAVDYEPYNSPYLTAVSNCKSLGEAVGKLITFLVEQGARPEQIHVLGHSLGSHIAGAAARSIASKIKIGRITGLDPAGPMFNNNKEGNRLSKTDATVVEAIHTSTEFGMTNPAGTHDYYCNGGGNQPSCSHAAMTGGCDHSASFRYYAQSIGQTNAFSVLKCNNVADAQSVSKAPSNCAQASGSFMGEIGASTTKPGIYFVPL